MFGIRTRRPPPFGGVDINDDKDIEIHRPEQASRNGLWAEARLLFRDLVFALMIAALAMIPLLIMVGLVVDGGLALANQRVSIPMKGMAESLNVAVAAGVLLFEASRQRR